MADELRIHEGVDSLKFIGPTYVPGSTDQDEACLDRIVVVPPAPSKDAE